MESSATVAELESTKRRRIMGSAMSLVHLYYNYLGIGKENPVSVGNSPRRCWESLYICPSLRFKTLHSVAPFFTVAQEGRRGVAAVSVVEKNTVTEYSGGSE
ncbi:hypothetical protein TRVL_04031 [Trypanosoma vivax]|nr:hypothetical protein TRVL_04031 [Trypanosoma vivax]